MNSIIVQHALEPHITTLYIGGWPGKCRIVRHTDTDNPSVIVRIPKRPGETWVFDTFEGHTTLHLTSSLDETGRSQTHDPATGKAWPRLVVSLPRHRRVIIDAIL